MDFENINVLHQLRCGGVLEAVRISCAGFPTKIPFIDFVDHFWNLVPELLSRADLDDAALSKAIVAKAGLKQHQAGSTKVSCVTHSLEPRDHCHVSECIRSAKMQIATLQKASRFCD